MSHVEPHDRPVLPALQYRERWSVTLERSAGPERVVTDQKRTIFKRYKIGFGPLEQIWDRDEDK